MHQRGTPSRRRGVRIGLLALLGAVSCTVNAQTYYVDRASGSDANSGTSTSSPWRSVSQVNQASLSPGDEVRFRRGQTFGGALELRDDGGRDQPIVVAAWGDGGPPVLYAITLRADHIVVEDMIIDHRKDPGDALRIRGGRNITLRDLELRNGTSDAIDAHAADNLLVESVEIHHFLAGALGTEDDAHGVTATSTDGVTISDADIHHVSGDSFQADPNRTPGAITNNIVIEDSDLWTGPLAEDFNDGWSAGDVPGENAVDTKVLKSGYEDEPRMRITITNVNAYGWTKGPAINNRAAFNLKEKIDAVLNRITVYDSEIAFRVRGGRGNADTRISNAVIYDVDKAIRAEDGLANLKVYNATFGDGIGTLIQQAGADSDVATWDMRNNAFLDGPPSEAHTESNMAASVSDFESPDNADYRLTEGAELIDQGDSNLVVDDRSGKQRTAPIDVGAYEWNPSPTVPKPPQLKSP